MKIKAIWNRDRVAPKSRNIFILTENGEFGEFSPVTEYKGEDAKGNRIYEDTKEGEFYPEKPLIGNKWDFRMADFFIKHFGGQLDCKY